MTTSDDSPSPSNTLSPPKDSDEASARIDPRRYLRLMLFLAAVFVHAVFWDLVLNRPVLRRLRRDPLLRWTGIARRFRDLAVTMGGVLIKLGQFLSTRVDLLPPEIIEELRGLQDAVAPASVDEIVAQIEEDFGQPLEKTFARFDRDPLGAASLAQVHGATLPDGREVVVKSLRPGIEVLVETDLKAISLAIRGLRLWGFVRRRVDLDRLADEFVLVTRRELDTAAEGGHAERFAENFKDDDGVRIPRVHWSATARRTLTLEDVGFLKLSDTAAIEEAGIDLVAVAAKLYDVYLRQIFVHSFVHADPHPGNLFVEPLPRVEDDPDADDTPTPFRLAFVDFGMVAEIPERLRASLREYVVALGTRDAHRLVRAYRDAGVLLPGADLRRLEEAHEALFDRFWGVRVGDLRDKALDEMQGLMLEYRDIIFDSPFQAQVDLVFVQRSVGILIGLVTSLDPGFDLWEATRPFAMQMIRESREQGFARLWAELETLASLPRRLERLARTAERGDLEVRTSLAPDSRRELRRLEGAVRRLGWLVLAAGLGVSGTVLWATESAPEIGLWTLGAAGFCGLWGLLRRA